MSSDLRAAGERVDRALAEVEGLEGEGRDRALELKGAIEAFHREGLRAIVRALQADPRGAELLLGLARDPGVFALFSLHGLVRVDLEAEIERILDLVRPYLRSHGGEVELAAVEGGVVRVRLLGACDGCSLSARTLRESVEATLRTHAPEIERVEVVEAGGAPEGEPEAGFVPLASLRRRGKGGAESGWVEGPPLAELEEGRPLRVAVAGSEGGAGLLLLLLGGRPLAYRNACGHQGLPLDGALVDPAEGTLTCPWHGYRFDAATGEGLTAPRVRLEAVPLRVEGGRVLVRPR